MKAPGSLFGLLRRGQVAWTVALALALVFGQGPGNARHFAAAGPDPFASAICSSGGAHDASAPQDPADHQPSDPACCIVFYGTGMAAVLSGAVPLPERAVPAVPLGAPHRATPGTGHAVHAPQQPRGPPGIG